MNPQDLKKVKKMIDDAVEKALDTFQLKHMSFRSRRSVDTPTDSLTIANKKTVTGSFPSNGGTFADGANLAFGTSAGTKIGTATNQKIGFYGKTPIPQQANTAGSVTAGATYTATERAMLNDSYSVLRNLGLLS